MVLKPVRGVRGEGAAMETLNDTDLDPSISTSEDDGTEVVASDTSDTPDAGGRSGERSKSAKPGDSSYEDGWYQVLKRRADESDDDA